MMKELVKEVYGCDATLKEISSDTVLIVITLPKHIGHKARENIESCTTRISDRAGGIPVLVVADDVRVEARMRYDCSPKRLWEQQQQEQVDDDYERKVNDS